MPTYKVLGQAEPASGTQTTLYTVPAEKSAVCSTLSICNTATVAATFRIRIKVAGAADNDFQFIAYDSTIGASDAMLLTFGATLGPADVVTCYSSSGNVVFQLFGSELP